MSFLLPVAMFVGLSTGIGGAFGNVDLGVDGELCNEKVVDTQLFTYFAESKGKVCPPSLSNKRKFNDSPVAEPELTKNIVRETKQEYSVEYINQCPVGLEFFGGCDQNPDAGRCDDGTAPYIRVIRFSGGAQDGQVYSQRSVCPEDNESDTGISEELIINEIEVTPEEFRRFPILPSELQSDPEEFSLRNGHTHLWATAETQTFNTTIASTAIEIKAIPVQWLWNYGDGTKRTLDFPGEPDPAHTLHDETPTSHSYRETGIFEVNVTTLYRGEFRIVGQGWQPIPGQAAVPSNALPIDVWRTKKELVATDGE